MACMCSWARTSSASPKALRSSPTLHAWVSSTTITTLTTATSVFLVESQSTTLPIPCSTFSAIPSHPPTQSLSASTPTVTTGCATTGCSGATVTTNGRSGCITTALLAVPSTAGSLSASTGPTLARARSDLWEAPARVTAPATALVPPEAVKRTGAAVVGAAAAQGTGLQLEVDRPLVLTAPELDPPPAADLGLALHLASRRTGKCPLLRCPQYRIAQVQVPGTSVPECCTRGCCAIFTQPSTQILSTSVW
mmetsp:Transcript_10346/g.16159  ORF Transcript_10346/g.16159 Transcript_10346/m.16159 type:complete len:251 (+) Transcript_10346:657-1409(+)